MSTDRQQLESSQAARAASPAALSRRHAFWRWLGFAALALVVTILALFAIEPRIGLDGLRPWLESVASARLGQPVRVSGPLELELSLQPGLHLSAVQVENPPGWSGPPLAEVESLGGRVALVPLLGGRLSIVELYADGARLAPRVDAAGATNWKLNTQPGSAYPKSEPRTIEVRRLSLRNLSLDLPPGRRGMSRLLKIDELEANSRVETGLSAVARGHWNTMSWRAALAGDHVAGLLAGESWSHRLELEALDNRAVLEGEVGLARKLLDTQLTLVSPDLQRLSRALGVSLPPIGASRASGDLSYAEGALAIADFTAAVGESRFEGDLELTLESTPPSVRGEFHVPVLDLAPWINKPGAEIPGVAPAHTSDTTREDRGFWDLDVDLRVGELIGMPVQVRDLAAVVTHQGGSWRADARALIDQAPLELALHGKRASGESRWQGQLEAGPADVQALAARMGFPRVLGGFRRLQATVQAVGPDTERMLSSLEVEAKLDELALEYGEDGVPLTLQQVHLTRSPTGPMFLEANGSLLQKPFDLAVEAENSLQGDLAIGQMLRARFEGGGAELTADGEWSGKELDVRLSLAGERIGDLARWLAVSSDAELAYALNGGLRISSNGWIFAADSWRLGASAGSGIVGRRAGEEEIWQIDFHAQTLDPLQLRTVQPQRNIAGEDRLDLALDLLVLPHSVPIDDADLDVRIRRLMLPGRELEQIQLIGQVRNGHLPDAAVEMTVGGQRLAGQLVVDLRQRLPLLSAHLRGENIDVGALYRGAGGGAGLEWQGSELNVDLNLRGHSLEELLVGTSLQAELKSSRWRWMNPATGKVRRFELDRTTLVVEPEQPTLFLLDGGVDGFPFSVRATTDPLVELVRAGRRSTLPVSATARGDGVDLDVTGRLPRLGSKESVSLEVAARAEDLSKLDRLFAVDLPPLGPLSLESNFQLAQQRASLSDFRLELGSSDLGGSLTFTQEGPRSILVGALRSHHLEASDLVTENWSALTGDQPLAREPGAAAAPSPAGNATRGLRMVEALPPLLSRAALTEFDVDVALDADVVTLGAEPLGKAHLRVQVQDGRLSIDPLDLDLTAGIGRARMDFVPTSSGASLELALDVDDFDYGIPARWVRPGTKAAGLVSVGADITARFDLGEPVLAHANGRFDFNARPQGIPANVFDFWATNLLFAILPSMDSEGDSVINCLNGQFNLRDGVLNQELLLLDTSKVRVVGEAEVNFQQQRVDLKLVPRPKRPQFLSVATPVEAHGKFSDFKFGVTPTGLAESIVRLTYYWVDVPLQWLLQGMLPKDGSDVCNLPPRRPSGAEWAIEAGNGVSP